MDNKNDALNLGKISVSVLRGLVLSAAKTAVVGLLLGLVAGIYINFALKLVGLHPLPLLEYVKVSEEGAFLVYAAFSVIGILAIARSFLKLKRFIKDADQVNKTLHGLGL